MNKRRVLFLLFLSLCLIFTGCSYVAEEIDKIESALNIADFSTQSVAESAKEFTEESITESTAEIVTESITEVTIEATMETTEKATEEPTEESVDGTIHTHSFTPATCTVPKTCSCGAIEGAENGHSWKDATCETPKTCLICGETSGSASSHEYSKGKCSSCGIIDPNYSSTTYVLNVKTMKFHRLSCHKLPTDNRKDTTMSREEIIEAGYVPCKLCDP